MTTDNIDHLLGPKARGGTTVTVRRRVVTADGIGGQKVSWRDVRTEPARVSMPTTGSLSEVVSALQAKEEVPLFVYLRADTAAQRGDILVDGRDNRQLWVSGVTVPSVPIFRRATVSEYQREGDRG